METRTVKNTVPASKIAAVRVRCTMSVQQRDIINVLSPDERLIALLEAGKRKMERLLSEDGAKESKA